MRHTLFLSLLSASFFGVAPQLRGQNLDSLFHLNDVVVTGTRTPKLLKDTPIQTRVISRTDIERADATNVEDLLQQEMPGVEFSYAQNQMKHMNMSGFGGQSVLFLVDGERLAGETMDDVDFARLSMDNVERIEIVKGAASALYGSNAGGGVVNIITKKNTTPWTLHLDGRLARHDDRRVNGSFMLHQKQWDNTLSVHHTSTDAVTLVNDPDPAAQVVGTLFGQRTWNFRDRLTYAPTDRLQLSARAGYYFREITRTADSPERYRDFSAGLRGLWSLTDQAQMDLSYSFDQYDRSDYHRITRIDVRDYSNVQNTIRALFTTTMPDGESTLAVGADYMHDYLMNKNLEGRDRSQDVFDAFAQYDWTVSDQVEVVGALRYDYFSEGRNSQLTPKLSARYRPADGLNLRASYGMGFRAPALKERYYNFDMAGIWTIIGNPDLKAELSHNVTLSADYTHGKYNFTLSGYYNKVRNKLSTGVPHYLADDATRLYLDYVNLSSYSVCGAEATIQARWSKSLSARLSYAYTSEHLPKADDGTELNNQYIPARPHSLTARVDWNHRFSRHYALDLSLSGRFLSSVDNKEFIDYYDVARGTRSVHYPAYTLWKLSSAHSISSNVKLTAALDNLLNYRPKYYYFNTPMTDGISLMVGAAITLGSE